MCFMVMSCLSVFCRQHLSVYAVLIVSRKTGGGKSAAWYLHTAAIPSGNDDGSLVAPKDRHKPRESTSELEWEMDWHIWSAVEEVRTWQVMRYKDLERETEGKADRWLQCLTEPERGSLNRAGHFDSVVLASVCACKYNLNICLLNTSGQAAVNKVFEWFTQCQAFLGLFMTNKNQLPKNSWFSISVKFLWSCS